MKRLIVLALLLVAGVANSGTLYPVSVTGIDTLGNFTSIGFSKRAPKIAAEGTGTSYLILTSFGASSERLYTFDGANWATNLAFFGHPGDQSTIYEGVQAYGDSAFAYGAMTAGPADMTVKKIVGVTPATTGNDTVQAGTLSAPRTGFVLQNSGMSKLTGDDTLMINFRWETTTTDTSFSARNDGALASGNTWSKADTMAGTLWGDGRTFAYPYGNATLHFDYSTKYLYIVDSLGHYDTLSTGLFSSSFTGGANFAGLQYAFGTLKDTLICAWQSGDVCYVKEMLISGTTPNITVTKIGDSVVLYAAADMPTPVTSTGAGYLATYWDPSITVGTNGEVYTFGKHWADQADLDSCDITYFLRTAANTWGSSTVFSPAVKGILPWFVQSPPWIVTTSSYTIMVGYVDSVGVQDRDSMYLYAQPFSVSGGGGSTSSGGIIRDGVIRSGVLRLWSEAWLEE